MQLLHKMNTFILPNLASQTATTGVALPLAPAPRPSLKDKPAFRAWCNEIGTNHMFYSLVEGLIPGLRISEANPPKLLHGFVADYDAAVTDAMIVDLGKAKGLLPTWSSRTFSGGARLVWEFAEAILCDCKPLAERFLAVVAKELKVKAALPGFDDASLNLNQYWEAGTDWQPVPGATAIPADVVGLWVFQAAASKSLKLAGVEIPLEEVAAEVDRQFPGRWVGNFELGARGPLFWVPDGVARVGCQVGSFGMLCFSSRAEGAFLSWGEVLGTGFVKAWEASNTGAHASTLWYDSKSYWWNVDGAWVARSKEDTIMHLKIRGVSAKTGPKDTASKAEQVLGMVQQTRLVTMAAPLIFDAREIVDLGGDRILNISRKEAMQELDGPSDPALCPWIWEFLHKIWDSHKERGCPQRDYFFAWFKRTWESARALDLAQGQMLVIAGEAGQGKTFLNRCIIGAALGGSIDASELLQGKTNFNKQAAETAIWRIDDATGASSRAEAKKFGETLKRHVANPTVGYHPKFKDAVELPWKGRIVMTCNTDPESLEVIPPLDHTFADKVMLLKFSDWVAEFLPNSQQEAKIAAELPAFLACLRDWVPPAAVLDPGKARFGVRSFLHPTLVRASRESGGSSPLMEVLELWRNLVRDTVQNYDPVVRLNATLLLSTLRENLPGCATQLREYRVEWFAKELQKLDRQQLYPPLVKIGTIHGRTVYHFDMNLLVE